MPLEQAQLGDLVAKVEARLREHPEDGEGWDVIAPVYLQARRFRDAANAYANAARLKGETVRRLAGLAEAAVLAADGIVTEEARAAYEKILKLEPGRVEPRFWLALAKEQDGKLADGARRLPGAAGRGACRRALARRRSRAASPRSSAPPRRRRQGRAARARPQRRGRGGRREARAAAARRDDRQMVDGLAQRLKSDGRDLAGWQRLVNAYAVLGRKQDARAALAEARQQLRRRRARRARRARQARRP